MENTEKQIATAILEAWKIHNDSYKTEDGDKFGEYKIKLTDAIQTACKNQKLSANFWGILDLAFHWMNDLQDWANDVLKNKTAGG